MSETNTTRLRNWGAVLTLVIGAMAVFTTFVASPKDVADINRRIAIIEMRYEEIEKRSRVDHDLIVRIDQTLQEMKARKP